MENLSKTEMKAMKVFFIDPEKQLTSTEAASLGKMPYISAFKAVEGLTKKKILNREIKGKTGLYTLNYQNQTAESLGKLIETEKKEDLLKENLILKIILDDVAKSFSDMFSDIIVSVVVFGSFVKGTEREGSDIDILFIVRSGTKTEYRKWSSGIRSLCRETSERHSKKLSPFILTTADFREGLRKKQTLVYEIYKNHAIVFGTEFYMGEVLKWLEKKQ